MKILINIIGLVMLSSCAQLQNEMNKLQGKVDSKTPYKAGEMISVTLSRTPYHLVSEIKNAKGLKITAKSLVSSDLAGATYVKPSYSRGEAKVRRNGVEGSLFFDINNVRVPSVWNGKSGVFSKLSFVGRVLKVSGKCINGTSSNGKSCSGNTGFVDQIKFIRWSKKNNEEHASIAKNKSLKSARAKSAMAKVKNDLKIRRATKPSLTKKCDIEFSKLMQYKRDMGNSLSDALNGSKRKFKEATKLYSNSSRVVSNCNYTHRLYTSSQVNDIDYASKCVDYYARGAIFDKWCTK